MIVDRVLVVVPARDEAERVGACITSVLDAAERAQGELGVSTWIVVAADGCTDETCQIALDALGDRGQVLDGDWGAVGSARRAGVLAGLDHLRRTDDEALTDVWIANTDADCQVPSDWLVEQLTHARMGADVVLGIVSVDNFDEHPDGVAATFTHRYILHADGSHEHVHGANLGVRADRYLQAGEWPHVTVSEDHALTNGLMRVGASIVRTIHISVTTSGRRSGRARGGFADMLVTLSESA